MLLRKSTPSDIPSVTEIIHQAQDALLALGIDQWQNGYPSVPVIEKDMMNGNGYVLVRNREIIATVAVIFSGEPTYHHIHNGAWLTGGDYAVIHRMAVKRHFKQKGVASYLLDVVEEMVMARAFPSIRIDTHEGNLPMLGLLRKKEYRICGVIYLADGSKRVALEKRVGSSAE